MTNSEKRKQLTEEFMRWFFRSEENRIKEPAWCNKCCEDSDGSCKACFNKWLNEEVKTTNFEKWKKKLSETKDGYELRATLLEMNYSFTTTCKDVVGICKSDCDMCFARWLDEEVKE